ncbi:MAG TPA: DUF11 domain-containing protein [Roseiflexaceae bacterium]|nr:DUF11 domain-containing protein [Roseiflexaceae bacterium]
MTTTHGVQRHTTARFGLAFALLAALLAGMFSLGTARAAVSIPSVQAYSQNFDTLPATGAPAWQNDVTLQGWYAAAGNTDITSIAAYNLDAPTSPSGGLYSFGASAGSNERALGLVGNSSNNPKRFGVVLKNTSGARIKTITVSYTGEQWYDGNTVTTTERLQFKYKQAASISAADFHTTAAASLTDYPSLDFNSPQNSGAGAIDGNSPANSHAVSATITLNPDFAPGNEMLLLWEKDNVTGIDDGLAVDDLSVTAGFATAAPQSDCPVNVTAFRNATTNVAVSAFDPNGIVNQANITGSSVAGISLTNQTPATAAGGTYSAVLRIDGTQAVGTYPVSIQFVSQDASETAQCTVNVAVKDATDLAVTKTGPSLYRPGQSLTYALTVNPGPSTANNVVLTDTLPAGLTYVSDDSGITPTQNGQTVVWNLGALSTQKAISLVTSVSASATGALVNTASASTSTTDNDKTNNTDSTTANPKPLIADFSNSTKTVSAQSVAVGQVFTYTLSIVNSGDADSTFALTDTLNAKLSVVNVSPGLTQSGSTLTATGPISAGEQISYTVSVKADSAGTINNAATLTGDGTTHTLPAPAVTVGIANFSTSNKTVDKNKIAPGGELVYTINVVNSGQQAGTFTLTDTLGPNLTVVSTSPTMTQNGQTLTATGDLAAGATQKYVITVQVKPNVAAGSVIDNSATVSGDGQPHTVTAQPVVVVLPNIYLPLIVKGP